MPRYDLLVWILVLKLAPMYYRKLNQLLTNPSRYRKLPSCRKGFKREWKKLKKTPITMPTNNVYKPNVNKMVCTCPYLATSRFLLCKHIVQGVLPVPPKFFLEVKQQREAPFWKHPSLKPLNTPTQIRDCESISHNLEQGHIQYLLDDIGRGDSDEDKDENFIDVGREDGQTFDEMVEEWTHTMQKWS